MVPEQGAGAYPASSVAPEGPVASQPVASQPGAPVTGVPGVAAVGGRIGPEPGAMVRRRLGGGGTVASMGLLTVLVGAWGGIVPFVGPLFNYRGTGLPGWDWNLEHALLFLVPGAVAVLMGFGMMAVAPSVSHRFPTSSPGILGFMTGLCGAWFVIGPLAWPVLEGAHVFVGASPLVELTYWIGYSLGPGLLLAMLGGLSMGISVLNRRDAANLGTVTVGRRFATRQAA